MNNFKCQHCHYPLLAQPEQELHEWILRCTVCGAKNIIEAKVKIIGWRD